VDVLAALFEEETLDHWISEELVALRLHDGEEEELDEEEGRRSKCTRER